MFRCNDEYQDKIGPLLVIIKQTLGATCIALCLMMASTTVSATMVYQNVFDVDGISTLNAYVVIDDNGDKAMYFDSRLDGEVNTDDFFLDLDVHLSAIIEYISQGSVYDIWVPTVDVFSITAVPDGFIIDDVEFSYLQNVGGDLAPPGECINAGCVFYGGIERLSATSSPLDQVLFPDPVWTPLLNSAVVPTPAAVWLFSSGLLGLIGFARRKVRS